MRRVALAIVSTIAGLVGLLTFKTHATTLSAAPAAISTAGTTGGGTSAGTSTGTSAGTSAGTSTAPASSTTGTSASATTTRTVTGSSIDTRWGPVQVKITVTGGKLAAVDAVVYPMNNGRDQEINAYAIPALAKEALAAGNAKIDTISGATYTSTGYINSLQSALDKAGLS